MHLSMHLTRLRIVVLNLHQYCGKMQADGMRSVTLGDAVLVCGWFLADFTVSQAQ